jgi:toxin CcdB
MAQFDVHPNPVAQAQRAYPFVVVLQSDVARSGRERVVAPVAPRPAFPDIAGRLIPIVKIKRREFVLLITSMTTIPAQGLGDSVVSLASRRDDILAAIDYLFFGV